MPPDMIIELNRIRLWFGRQNYLDDDNWWDDSDEKLICHWGMVQYFGAPEDIGEIDEAFLVLTHEETPCQIMDATNRWNNGLDYGCAVKVRHPSLVHPCFVEIHEKLYFYLSEFGTPCYARVILKLKDPTHVHDAHSNS